VAGETRRHALYRMAAAGIGAVAGIHRIRSTPVRREQLAQAQRAAGKAEHGSRGRIYCLRGPSSSVGTAPARFVPVVGHSDPVDR
jgi:hypothetical protein